MRAGLPASVPIQWLALVLLPALLLLVVPTFGTSLHQISHLLWLEAIEFAPPMESKCPYCQMLALTIRCRSCKLVVGQWHTDERPGCQYGIGRDRW